MSPQLEEAISIIADNSTGNATWLSDQGINSAVATFYPVTVRGEFGILFDITLPPIEAPFNISTHLERRGLVRVSDSGLLQNVPNELKTSKATLLEMFGKDFNFSDEEFIIVDANGVPIHIQPHGIGSFLDVYKIDDHTFEFIFTLLDFDTKECGEYPCTLMLDPRTRKAQTLEFKSGIAEVELNYITKSVLEIYQLYCEVGIAMRKSSIQMNTFSLDEFPSK